MSDKLTKEMLDALIQEAMLQEKQPFNISLDDDDFKNWAKLNKKIGANKGKFDDQKKILDTWKKIIALDGDGKNFSAEDALAALKDKNYKDNILQIIKKKRDPKLSDQRKKALMTLTYVAQAPDVSLEDLGLGSNPSAEDIAAQFDKYKTLSDKETETAVGTIELPYRSLATDKNWISGTDLKLGRGLSPVVIEVFKKGLQDAGGDLQEYFKDLQRLGDALALVSGSNTDKITANAIFDNKQEAEEYLKKLDPSELFNTAVLVKTLGELVKEVQGASAGTIFETFLALMVGGGVGGGAGGAADVVAGNKGERLFSAKQHDGKPSGSQSAINFINELGDDKSKIMWYIALAKMGPGESIFNRIDIYISGVSWNGNDKYDPTSYICYSASEPPTPIGTLEGDKQPQNAKKGVQWNITYGQNPDYSIPLSNSWADTGSIKTFDKMFVTAIDSIQDKVKTAIKDMNIMLNRLNDQTKIYIANKAPDSAKKIGDDYKNLKVAITSGIGQIGTDPQKGEFKTQADLEENKMIELDLMVENMVKQFLKGNLND